MKVSIIVPVYNMASEHKLNYCLDSLINQTLTDIEIIAVNDASTDNSLEILREYESKYPDRFKVITYPDNRHQGGARNEGIKAAQGDWIGFVDSDDWFAPDYCEKLVKRGEDTGADVVAANLSLVYEHTMIPGREIKSVDASRTGIFNDELHKAFLLASGSIVTRIYRRSLIVDNHLDFPEHIFYEDNAAGPVWSMYFKHLELVDEPLYFYYQHDTSTVHTITEARCRDRLTACEIILHEFKERGFYDTYRDELEALYIRLYLVNTLFGYMINGTRKNYRFVRHIKVGMLKEFPDFRSNRYYPSIPDNEQLKMINLLMKNSFAFYVYYNALWKYRKLRGK